MYEHPPARLLLSTYISKPCSQRPIYAAYFDKVPNAEMPYNMDKYNRYTHYTSKMDSQRYKLIYARL